MTSKTSKESVSETIFGETQSQEPSSDQAGDHPSSQNKTTTPGEPHWNVDDSKPTPFVSDFFHSHPDKVLGI